jgi:glycosyltransferase involved in cell wall biosynthesis
MAPIRVLQVFTTMGRGGAEAMIMNYYRHIDREKIQFDFLVHRQERAAFEDEIEALGGKIYRLPAINPLFPKPYYKTFRHFLKLHSEYKIIHSHLNTFSYFPLKIAEEFQIPTRIAHAHIAMDPISTKNTFKSIDNILEAVKKGIKLRVKKKIKTHSTHLFSCGIKAGNWLFGAQSEFFVMNNAIDSSSFKYNPDKDKALKKQFGLEKKVVLGHIGRFTHQKNHEFLIEIMVEVLRQDPNYELVLIGDGPLQNKIKEQAKKLNIINHIQFLGLRTNISELLQMIDVFVFPSFYEGLPVTLIEAQAAGLKIMASDTITTEVKLTENIEFLPLKKSAKFWAESILNEQILQKEDTTNKIIAGKYDIVANADEIEKFYSQNQ